MAALDQTQVKEGVDQDTVDAVREVGGAYKHGWNTDIESNAIQVHIHALRRKLPEGLIRTVRGVGYMVPEAS